ncbi:mevalonate kinase [Brevibacterium sp.]|uniref:mevalonate kinase n=1 Tax=Brevibacterium sp. TaxID=1701 RepID=UPI0025C13E03|nr:mevalonate kinase [Brevibacterium sp.]
MTEGPTGTAAAPTAAPAAVRTTPAVGTAHAKAILFGEHSVVYGSPAVAIPLTSLNATARITAGTGGLRIDSDLYSGAAADAPPRLQPLIAAVQSACARTGADPDLLALELTSSIPYERGLGSSAAVAVAVARAVAALTATRLDEDEVHEVVMAAERIAHGRSSGLDGRTVASSSPIRFQNGVVTPVEVGGTFEFVLADSGHAGSTSEAVGSVRARMEDSPSEVGAVLNRLGALAEGSLRRLAAGDVAGLGEQMDDAHALLAELGVSDASLETLVAAARGAGAAGAKLTGGGRGGCVLTLARDGAHAAHIAETLRAAGAARTWQTKVEPA